MRTPHVNPEGYFHSAVRNATGFKSVPGGFAIMHGLADYNVHYQNTAVLVDRLIAEGVSPEQLEWRAYTDSAHNIAADGASADVLAFLAKKLYEEKHRKPGYVKQHQWSQGRIVSVADAAEKLYKVPWKD